MKLTLIATLLLLAGHVVARDMSRTERWQDAYTEEGNYVGRCQLHQDYQDIHYRVVAEVVSYFEPSYGNEASTRAQLAGVPSGLIDAVEKQFAPEGMSFVDDITVETIEAAALPEVVLYRLNIGVGGGNGMYVVFQQLGDSFELLSEVFDGDVEFCHAKVWSH